MLVTLRRQYLTWPCPDCGSVSDTVTELLVDGKPLGRWFTDGHFGYTQVDDNELEYRVVRALGIDFMSLEHLRSRRNRDHPTGHPALGEDFRAFLVEHGHDLERQEYDYEGEARPLDPAAHGRHVPHAR